MKDTNTFELKDLVAETIVINPPHLASRRVTAQALCDRLGLSNVRYSEGVSGQPHQLACTLAHRQAMHEVTTWPSLILEDDLELAGDVTTLGLLPEDADIVYLSVTPYGCLPWTYDNLAMARHQAIRGLTLASVHSDDWLKVHSMSGAPAILYVTEAGLDAWKQATFQSKRFGGAFDVFTAYAMKDVNVYAPHRPMFCENADAQRDDLKNNKTLFQQRLDFTRKPIATYSPGDQTVVYFKGQTITVEATQVAENSLQWSVVSVEKPVAS